VDDNVYTDALYLNEAFALEMKGDAIITNLDVHIHCDCRQQNFILKTQFYRRGA
jgi:hypothetical protein